MKPTFRAHSGPRERSRRLLFLVSVLALAAGVAPALAEDEAPALSPAEIEEIERDMERMEQERGEISKAGSITCGDDYCEGLFDDLIAYTWLRKDGYQGVRVSAAVEQSLAASSQNCSSVTSIYTMLANESNAVKRETVRQWAGRLQVARAMGYVIRLKWVQHSSSWPVCFMDQLYVFGPPAS